MPIRNADIAAVFEEIANLLEIEGANPFRVRAYRNATRTVENLGQDIATLVKEGNDLTELPGIGKDLAAKMKDIAETGTTPTLEDLRKRLPPEITEMLKLPGLGPKRVKTLYQDLKIESMAQLKEAAEKGQIRGLPGLGEKTEQQILQAIARRTDTTRRFMRAAVVPYVESLLDFLQRAPGVKRVSVAGSYRRARETVGDLDILATSPKPEPVMKAFVEYDEVTEVLARGDTKSSVVLRSGIQVDLRVVEEKSYGAAMHYFTGSKAHNIAIRRLGQQRGLKVNEYGVFKGDAYQVGKSEEDVFEAVGLPYIQPELREDRGEMEAAAKDALPALVEQRHIKGDLHAHTTASDGHHSIEEMAQAAKERGYQYLAITEHSKRLTVAGGLDENRLLKQVDEIDKLNGRLEGFTILKGIEVDILGDGGLDLSDDCLSRLDLVIGSVHSRFNLPREQQTERILRAMDHPHFTILAHPTGRLVLSREPYEVDMERVIKHAAQRGCYLELNAHPMRLDLIDTHCQMAKAEGVLVSIDTDAHSISDFDNMVHGLGQARRGWLEKKDVLNTRTLKQLLPLLKKTMGGKEGLVACGWWRARSWVMFRDRIEAAELLAERLSAYRGRNPLVLGIPRGGVVMAAVIAEKLQGEVDVVLVHKLGEPGNPEVAIGSVDEAGRVNLSEYADHLGVGTAYIEEESRAQLRELRRRRALYTPIREPVDPRGRTVLVVDDGLATGSTMMGALESLKGRGAKRLVAATAVAPPDTASLVGRLADEVVCLRTPRFFRAVGQFFEDFSQVEDEEVVEALRRATTDRSG